ncbi:MAG TPA: aldo/keto reductase, partial [Polyangiaceae bacterium]|nr:aldo/keto reductase [Polyangiaceae bacterium]
ALRYALGRGVNLIDTASSYQAGDSERVVGQVLAALTEQKTLRRDQVVVVTKLGLLRGAALREHQLREQKGEGAPEVVKVSDELWQCLHPGFLEQELARSLERLGLTTVDVCLLQNPEHFLEAEAARSLGLSERRAEYYRRIENAFEMLERAVQLGTVGCYGVSSNTLGRAAEDPLATDAALLLVAARRAGGPNHHFRVLEAPINLREPAVATLKNTGPGASQSVLEFARAEGLGVLANRPLQAFLPQGILRLVDPETSPDTVPFEAAVERVAALEQRFTETLAPSIRVPEGALPATELFAWARNLVPVARDLVSLTQFEEIESALVLPRLEDALTSLNRAFGPTHPTWSAWRDAYAPAIGELLSSLRQQAALRTTRALDEIRKSLEPHLARDQDPPFVELALGAVRQLPGVSSVLVGMRKQGYVDDAVASLQHDPLSEPHAAFEQLLASS